MQRWSITKYSYSGHELIKYNFEVFVPTRVFPVSATLHFHTTSFWRYVSTFTSLVRSYFADYMLHHSQSSAFFIILIHFIGKRIIEKTNPMIRILLSIRSHYRWTSSKQYTHTCSYCIGVICNFALIIWYLCPFNISIQHCFQYSRAMAEAHQCCVH